MQETWDEKRCSWLALHLIPGLGNVGFKRLLDVFGSPEQVFRADPRDLVRVEGISKAIAGSIRKKAYQTPPEDVLEQLEKVGARVVMFSDRSYPPLLREIHDPPMVLYLKGLEIPPQIAMVAVVGSRNPTPYGIKAAEKIGQGLARRGVGVVSGMAKGIDSAAHIGCISGKGFTVAVMGTGIDIVYPASNKELSEKIVEQGVLVTEFPLKSPPEPRNFPIRNRIISGLSRGLVVVEATTKSGSLITASLALEQGREVFAVPGSINSFKSTGCHYLIKQGARLVENSDDVLEELNLNYKHIAKTDTFREIPPLPMDEDEKSVYELIGEYPIHIDQIARDGKLKVSEVAGILTKMELKGMVRQLPGKMFVR